MASGPAPRRSAEKAVPYAEHEDVAQPQLSAEEQSAAWKEWADHGPQGPIEDDDEAEVPQMLRGDIRWFRFTSPDKRRPVLVLGNDGALPSFSQVPVIPLSTRSRGLSQEVTLTPADGTPSPCVLKPEWIRAVDRRQLGQLIGRLDERRWPEVRSAVLDALGL